MPDYRVFCCCLKLGLLTVLASLCVLGCTPGEGDAEFTGSISIPACGIDGDQPFVFTPSFFGAEYVADTLQIRLQNGSDLEQRSDGIFLRVTDPDTLSRTHIGEVLPIGASSDERPNTALFLYLNDTCPSQAPVGLTAVSGSIRFESIYAPGADNRAVEIRARLTDVVLANTRNPEEGSGLLQGEFGFLYNRGRPAQRFP